MYATSENEAVDSFIHFLQETVSKKGGGHRFIFVTQVFAVTKVPGQPRFFKVNTREYSYRLSDSGDIGDNDLIAYHWHPHEFAVRYPHLHVRSVKRVHFPTSRVCLEDFVRLIIDYYDVQPVLAHSEWTSILEKNKKAFDKGASWKIMP